MAYIYAQVGRERALLVDAWQQIVKGEGGRETGDDVRRVVGQIGDGSGEALLEPDLVIPLEIVRVVRRVAQLKGVAGRSDKELTVRVRVGGVVTDGFDIGIRR